MQQHCFPKCSSLAVLDSLIRLVVATDESLNVGFKLKSLSDDSIAQLAASGYAVIQLGYKFAQAQNYSYEEAIIRMSPSSKLGENKIYRSIYAKIDLSFDL